MSAFMATYPWASVKAATLPASGAISAQAISCLSREGSGLQLLSNHPGMGLGLDRLTFIAGIPVMVAAIRASIATGG